MTILVCHIRAAVGRKPALANKPQAIRKKYPTSAEYK